MYAMALGLSGYSYPTKLTGDSVSISCCRCSQDSLPMGQCSMVPDFSKFSFELNSKNILSFLQCLFQVYWNSVSLGCGLHHRTVAEPVTMAQERKDRSSPSHRHID